MILGYRISSALLKKETLFDAGGNLSDLNVELDYLQRS